VPRPAPVSSSNGNEFAIARDQIADQCGLAALTRPVTVTTGVSLSALNTSSPEKRGKGGYRYRPCQVEASSNSD
jgi:hypothetical protein